MSFNVNRRVVYASLVVGSGLGYFTYIRPWLSSRRGASPALLEQLPRATHLPSRAQQLEALRTRHFDVLVVGGGATGAGCAVDAASRGLNTALVEKFDFSSGTSSRSTKLIHGGVRYLEKAVKRLDIEQYRMVKEALSERANLLENAPHISYPLPIMLPVYKWWQLPYFYAGIKMYDFVAGKELIKPSYAISKQRALDLFPMLKKDRLTGAIVYYDGAQNDARMNIALALTAVRLGATAVNHTIITELLKEKNEQGVERVVGARCKDLLTGEEFEARAKCVINATGPYTDTLRQMDDDAQRTICQPSSGVHIILPDYYSPDSMGLLDPATSDGRIIFFLPWQKATIAGTTDRPCDVSDNPEPTEKEIQFILNEIRDYLSPDMEVRRGDVLSAWTGIRPLVLDPKAKNTESVARHHIIDVSDSGLVTIAGGKWTTYRRMAEETIDRAVTECGLTPDRGCCTKNLRLEGAEAWSPTLHIGLVQDFGLETEVAQHLANTYGDKAYKVARMAQLTGKRWPVVGRRLHAEFPYIEAEVRYAVREYAATAWDILARRTRIAFLNVQAGAEALDRVIEIMTEELGWDKKRIEHERTRALHILRKEMGLELGQQASRVPVNFEEKELEDFRKRFQSLDTDNNGYITLNDLRRFFKKSGEKVSEAQLHEILNEVDLAHNGKVHFSDFLQMMSAVRTGAVSTNRLVEATRPDRITVDRSGGGV